MTNNDVPQALLDLAELALGRGFDSVYLGFEGLGFDFPAPIGWSLHLMRRDSQSIYELTGGHADSAQLHSDRLMVDMHRQHSTQEPEQPRAYVGHWPENTGRKLDDPKNYIDLEQITRWITEPTVLAPSVDENEREQLLRAWPLFQQAVLNGWTASRTLKRADFESFKRFSTGSPLTMGAALDIDAGNNFYNIDGHPQNRSTGAPVSTSAHLFSHLGMEETTSSAFFHGDEPYRPVTGKEGRERFEALVASNAPWFVRVAGFDDEQEEWVLPAEATSWKTAQPC